MFNEVTTYGILLLYFFLFFLAVWASVRHRSGGLKDILTGKGEPGVLLNRLIAGIFFLGTGTIHIGVTSNLDTDIFLLLPLEKPVYAWWLLTVAALITGTVSACKKITPCTSLTPFLPSSFPLTFGLIRTLFLIVYEFFFRGMMLFVMMEDFGTAAAIAINIVFYVLIHWFNKTERYGSVLMGLILCGITIYYHSVWPVVCIHAALALGHEFTLFLRYKLFTKNYSI